jgi:hypothetical protein
MTNPDHLTYPDPVAVTAAAEEVRSLRAQLAEAEGRLHVEELLRQTAEDRPNEDEPTHPQEEPMQTTPDPTPLSLDDQIAQAEKSGDWLEAGQLKLQKLHEAQPETVPAQDPNLQDQITEAEARGDWLTAGTLKTRLARGAQTPETPAPFSPELAAAIAEAEAAGDWGRAGMLKAGAIRIEEAH